MSRRRLTVREHEAWVNHGRPTQPTRIHRLLDEIAFEDCREAPRPQEAKQTEAADVRDCQ